MKFLNDRENTVVVTFFYPNGKLAHEKFVLPGKNLTYQNVFFTKERRPQPFRFKFYDQLSGSELWLTPQKRYSIPLLKTAPNEYIMKGYLKFDDKCMSFYFLFEI